VPQFVVNNWRIGACWIAGLLDSGMFCQTVTKTEFGKGQGLFLTKYNVMKTYG
jgi:hypothetical protein